MVISQQRLKLPLKDIVFVFRSQSHAISLQKQNFSCVFEAKIRIIHSFGTNMAFKNQKKITEIKTSNHLKGSSLSP